MNLNFNTKNLTAFAKWMAGAIATFAAAWATPSTHDALVGIITKYPHGSEAVGVIAAAMTIWATFHNPVKESK